MVALLKEESFARYTAAEAVRLSQSRSSRPRLTLVRQEGELRLDIELTQTRHRIESPRHGIEPTRADQSMAESDRPPLVTPAFAAATAIVILLLLSLVRISQGAPPSTNWDSLAPAPASIEAPGAGEIVRVVDVGDTLWDIAGEIAPQSDRRQVVDSLASRNGGSGLMVGQRLVIPAELLTS